MTNPTDSEIIALADETRTAEGSASGYILPISFARAVLAKWGTPPQISESDTDYWLRHRALILQAIEDRGFRLVSSGGLFWLQHHGIKGGQHGTEY